MKAGTRTAVAVIEFSDDRILLVRRATAPFKGYWALVGGRVDTKETAEQAVIREVKEETGLDVEIIGKIGDYHEKGIKDGIKYDYYPTCFVVRPIAGKIKRQESEVEDIELFNVERLPEKIAFKHKCMVRDYILQRKKNI
jgi:8-oxo-dGTP pyrophosphatase MutT (NUDIX family)